MKRNRILNMVMAAGIILFAMIVSMSFTACSVNDNPTPEPVIPKTGSQGFPRQDILRRIAIYHGKKTVLTASQPDGGATI